MQSLSPAQVVGLSVDLHAATEEELRAFVGPHADYYVHSWLRFRDGEVRRPRFRVSAFWLGPFALAYRKQYRAAVIIIGLVLTESMLEDFIFLPYLGLDSAPREWTFLLTLVIGSITGLFANSWYLKDALRAIARTRQSGNPPEERLRELASRGGRSIVMAVLVPLGALIATVVVLGGLLLALGVPLE